MINIKIYAYVIRWFLMYIHWFSRLTLFNDFYILSIHEDLISNYFNTFIVFNDHCIYFCHISRCLNVGDKKFVQKSFYVMVVCHIFFRVILSKYRWPTVLCTGLRYTVISWTRPELYIHCQTKRTIIYFTRCWPAYPRKKEVGHIIRMSYYTY